MKSIIASLEESGEIMDDDAVHKLELHVTAVSQYEQKNEADKVIKHMKSFKALLDYQKENELISDKAHKMLQTKADAMIQIWQ
ncbi:MULTISPECIES: FIMAH domain-containing protein [Bacillaceae]|uniref:FIMAH domain-containing protein n=1 Tax=Bacillaceae TaxID=186817 RepID=UPI0035314AD8